MISAVIPAYNCRPWIEEALRSLLDQSTPIDEILVADDASSDGTADFVDSLALPSVRVFRSETNLGISKQLNRLLEAAQGRYVLRMDGDDISLPQRVASQMKQMHSGHHGVIGTACKRFGTADTIHRFYTEDSDLKASLLFSVPFCHPTVLFDRDKLGDALRYDPEFDLAEDYHLWTRLRSTASYANLPDILFHWRMHQKNAGTSSTTAPIQRKLSTTIRRNLMAEYGLSVPETQFQAFDDWALGKHLDSDGLDRFLGFLKEFRKLDPLALGTTRASVDRVLFDQWTLACHFAAWKNRGIPLLWSRGCTQLRISRSVKTGAILAVKAILGTFRK